MKDKRRKSSRIANERENKSRITKVYKKGDKVLIILNRIDRGAKLNSPTEGPYEIVKVYTNGTIKISILRRYQSPKLSHSTNECIQEKNIQSMKQKQNKKIK